MTVWGTTGGRAVPSGTGFGGFVTIELGFKDKLKFVGDCFCQDSQTSGKSKGYSINPKIQRIFHQSKNPKDIPSIQKSKGYILPRKEIPRSTATKSVRTS